MTPRKRRFIEAYARLGNGKQAAIAAGYAPAAATAIASRLLRHADVQEALIAQGVPLAFSSSGGKPRSRIAKVLTPRQERFIAHYLVLGKGAEAARRAGYSPRSAASIADKLLHTPRVAAAIAEANAARAKSLAVAAIDVVKELARLGFSDMRKIADWDAKEVRLRRAAEVSPEDSAAIARITVNGKRVDIKLHNKVKALDALARHLRLFDKRHRYRDADAGRADQEARTELARRLLRMIAAPRTRT